MLDSARWTHSSQPGTSAAANCEFWCWILRAGLTVRSAGADQRLLILIGRSKSRRPTIHAWRPSPDPWELII